MARDKAIMSGFVVRSAQIQSVRDAVRCLPTESVRVQESLLLTNPEAALVLYYSPERFSSSPDAEKGMVEWGDRLLFEYPLLIVKVADGERPWFLFSTQYVALTRKLGRNWLESVIQRRLAEHDIDREAVPEFCALDLESLWVAIEERRHAGGNARIKEIDFAVFGEPQYDRFTSRGADIAHSDFLKHIRRIAGRRGIALKMRRIVVAWGNKPAVRLGCDTHGNMKVRASYTREALADLVALFDYLRAEQLTIIAPLFPPHRGTEPEEAL